MSNEKITNEQLLGAVYGLAFGDAWGYTTEFLEHHNITEKHLRPPLDPTISDDTQMSIYNIFALAYLWEETGFNEDWQIELLNSVDIQNHVRKTFADQHLLFGNDPDNNRAPGLTCMESIREYEQSVNNGQATTGLEGIKPSNHSKGCGTIMRSPWIGLLTKLNRESVAVISVLQSQTTHGHPDSWVAAAVAALLVKDISAGKLKDFNSSRGLEVVSMSFSILKELENLPSSIADETFLTAVRRVNNNFKELIDSKWNTFYESDIDVDVTALFGEGWTADEALFTSVATASLYQNQPTLGVKRLVWTSGDSDSIAAVGGALMYVNPDIDSKELQAMLELMFRGLEPRYKVELHKVCELIEVLNK